jgi:hypothetical protein
MPPMQAGTPSTAAARDELLIRSRSPFLGVTVGNLSSAFADELRIDPLTEGVVIRQAADIVLSGRGRGMSECIHYRGANSSRCSAAWTC